MQKFWKGFAAGILFLSAALACLYSWQDSPRQRLKRALRLKGSYRWQEIEPLHKQTKDGVALEILRLDGTRAYFLYPESRPSRIPAVILLHGHLSSAAEFIEEAKGSKLKPIAWELARKGFAVLVPEARYEMKDMKEETRQALQLLLSGRTLMGERTADALRSLHYLKSLSFVDGGRVGILGWSMGGQIALYAMALEPSFRAAYISGAATALEVAILAETPLQTADNYVPYLIQDFGDKADLLCLAAPRPVLVEHGSNDRSEPLGGVMLTLQKAQACYESRSAGGALERYFHEGGHFLNGLAAAPWFSKTLGTGK